MAKQKNHRGTIQKRKYKDGSIAYLAQVRVKPFRPTSKSFPTRKQAEQWADEMYKLLRAERSSEVREDIGSFDVRQLAHDFLEDPETQQLRYYKDLQLLLAWWVNHYGATKVLDLGARTLRQARAKLLTGRKPATVNRYLSAMRKAWNWALETEQMPGGRSWPKKLLLTENNERKRFLSDDELAALLEAAAAHSALMYAAIVTSVATGMRQSELLRLRWSDVDFDNQTVRIRLSKNNESRAVYLPKTAAAALRDLKRRKVVQLKSSAEIFVDDANKPIDKSWIEYRWRTIRDAAKLQDFKWHDLRHSCASFLAQNGANLLQIGAVLGHKSPSMTQRYAHLVKAAPVTGHENLDAKLNAGSR